MQIELLALDNNTFIHLTVCKLISSGSLKKFYLQSIRLEIIYI